MRIIGSALASKLGSDDPREDKAMAENSEGPAKIVPRRAASPTLVAKACGISAGTHGPEKLRMVSK